LNVFHYYNTRLLVPSLQYVISVAS